MIGLIISYFIGVTVNYSDIASPTVLLKAVVHYLIGEGAAPSADSVFRSIGVTVIPLVSIFGFGVAWRRYQYFLEDTSKSHSISLWKEVPQVVLLTVSPIGVLGFFSPAIQLTGYPAALSVERYGGGLFALIVISSFFYRTRKRTTLPT